MFSAEPAVSRFSLIVTRAFVVMVVLGVAAVQKTNLLDGITTDLIGYNYQV